MSELIVTVGIPGSGKSTWSRTYQSYYQCIVVNPDAIRKLLTGDISNQSRNKDVWAVAYFMIDEALKGGASVVLDATNVSIKTVSSILSRYSDLKIYVKFFDCTPEEAKRRIAFDIKNKVDRSNVPSEVIDRMYNELAEMKTFVKEQGIKVKE